jgi:hypothetical protein
LQAPNNNPKRGIDMIQENEIIMLVLGIGVLIFILGNRLSIQRVPESRILIAGFCVQLAGWLLTVLEGFFLEGVLNYFEHMCYAVSALLVAFWCFKTCRGKEEAD